jgi:hypothetical protein
MPIIAHQNERSVDQIKIIFNDLLQYFTGKENFLWTQDGEIQDIKNKKVLFTNITTDNFGPKDFQMLSVLNIDMVQSRDYKLNNWLNKYKKTIFNILKRGKYFFKNYKKEIVLVYDLKIPISLRLIPDLLKLDSFCQLDSGFSFKYFLLNFYSRERVDDYMYFKYRDCISAKLHLINHFTKFSHLKNLDFSVGWSTGREIII